jgi:hypothetical protein
MRRLLFFYRVGRLALTGRLEPAGELSQPGLKVHDLALLRIDHVAELGAGTLQERDLQLEALGRIVTHGAMIGDISPDRNLRAGPERIGVSIGVALTYRPRGPRSTGSSALTTRPNDPQSLLARVDHLVYATPDLPRGIDEIEQLLGVRASAGGQHRNWGTHNALLALGPRAYLEIIAPDPTQPPPARPRPFGLDTLRRSRLVAWAANGSDLDSLHARAAQNGVQLGNVLIGSRERPDGKVLSWKLTDLYRVVADGIVPFFIDWGASVHPAGGAAKGARLLALRAETPDAAQVVEQLTIVSVNLPVESGAAPALVATIDCPRGKVELR